MNTTTKDTTKNKTGDSANDNANDNANASANNGADSSKQTNNIKPLNNTESSKSDAVNQGEKTKAIPIVPEQSTPLIDAQILKSMDDELLNNTAQEKPNVQINTKEADEANL